MEHVWRSALGRWGDELWGLALLRTGDKTRAQQALVRAFERVYAAQPPTDAHSALVQALLPPRQRWLPRVSRQRALPPPLRRIGSTERMLLGLWLVHGHDGDTLARLAQISTTTLQARLVRALLPLLSRRDSARRTKDGRAAWGQWLGQQLRLSDAPLPDTIPDTTLAGWQQVLNRVRDLLAVTVERQHLPGNVRDNIEATLLSRDDAPPPWQRWVAGLAFAALLAAVGWIFLRPAVAPPAAQTTAPSSASPQPADARSLAQAALDAWTTMPVSGTLHRRVWAVDTRQPAHTEADVTDVWLASDTPQYRVETTHDSKLVEWHVVDSQGQLHTEANPLFNMCQWTYGGTVNVPPAQTIMAAPAQVRAIRDERLRSGAYGEGYRLLHRARQAPDLRSYGVRNEGAHVLVTLGFRDETGSHTQGVPGAPARTVLLLLDGRTHALQVVRELVGDATQATARDLWRVDKEESLPAVPGFMPEQATQPVATNVVLDPACPGLRSDYVVSLRRLATILDPPLPVPTPLPANVVQAALVSAVPTNNDNFFQPQEVFLVLRSAGGWLRLHSNGGVSGTNGGAAMIRRGAWNVRFDEPATPAALLSATVWRNPETKAPGTPYDTFMLNIEASGWTRDQVLDMVDRLQTLDARTWPALAPRFLDPHPLPADVLQVLTAAQQALATPPDGTLHVVMHASTRASTPPPPRADPYHLPPSVTSPSASTVEQWATISNGVPLRLKQVATGEDGTLLSASVGAAPSQYSWYEARAQQVVRSTLPSPDPYTFASGDQTLGVDLARPLLAWDTPISMTVDGDAWRLEQVVPGDPQVLIKSGFWFELIRNQALFNYTPIDDLRGGTIVQQVWLDRAHTLPRRWQLVHRAPNGTETTLYAVDVQQWRAVAPPQESFWALPPLPPDTVLSTLNASNTPVPNDPGTSLTPQPHVVPPTIDTVGGPISLTPPKQALAWQPDSGLVITNDTPYRSPAPLPAQGPPRGSILDVLLYYPAGIESTGLVRSTRYALPNAGAVTVTQGPRALLRLMLRQTDGSLGAFAYTPAPIQGSERVQVTIAGAQHDAWVLHTAVQASLVVEIDDVLLDITGPPDYVGGVVLQRLPALKWEPVQR